VKADLGIRAGDLVRHNSYKDLLGIVVEVLLLGLVAIRMALVRIVFITLTDWR
jgi:hypothetical protein